MWDNEPAVCVLCDSGGVYFREKRMAASGGRRGPIDVKRFLYSILAAVIALTGAAALAEASRPAGTHVNTLFTEGSFVVQIDVPGGDMGWLAEVIDPDGAAVTLYDADVLEDPFVARFDAAHDGEATILLRHFYSACACDQAMTWDLLVEGGEVKEVKGGSQTDSPADGELDP